MNSKDYFSFIREFPHTLSIFLTFTIDKEVIDKIRESSSGRTIIIHDLKTGLALRENYKSRLICIPAVIPTAYSNCFHSKLVILKGYDKIRILTGSMNLTRSSFSVHQEMCFQKDLDLDSTQFREIIKILEAIKLPESININFIDELKTIEKNEQTPKRKELTYIDNSKSSIAEKLIDQSCIREFKKPTLKIVTPFLSRKLSSGYLELLEKINPQRVELYTRSSNKLPIEIRDSKIKTLIYNPLKGKSKFNFHAKIIFIDYGSEILLYLGSGNFTEQGFFNSLKNGGNQECGAIIKTDNPAELKYLREWLQKGWEKPKSIEEWIKTEETDPTEEQYIQKPYGFAIREGKLINLFLYSPDLSGVMSQQIEVNKQIITVIRKDGLFHSTLNDVSSNTENLKIIFCDEEIDVVIFQTEKYSEWRKYDGDSLFSYQSTPIESVNDHELSEAIEKEGIRVGSGNTIIIEPPKLEQFYQNVRKEINFIKKKKYFSVYHQKELEEKLSMQNGGMGIYFIMQLLKVFKLIEVKNNFSMKPFSDTCYKYLDKLLYDVNKDQKGFYKFLKQWLKYD